MLLPRSVKKMLTAAKIPLDLTFVFVSRVFPEKKTLVKVRKKYLVISESANHHIIPPKISCLTRERKCFVYLSI